MENNGTMTMVQFCGVMECFYSEAGKLIKGIKKDIEDTEEYISTKKEEISNKETAGEYNKEHDYYRVWDYEYVENAQNKVTALKKLLEVVENGVEHV